MLQKIKDNLGAYMVISVVLLPFVLVLIGHKSMSFLWEDTYDPKAYKIK